MKLSKLFLAVALTASIGVAQAGIVGQSAYPVVGNISGVTPVAGIQGEYPTPVTGTGVSLPSGTSTNCASITLSSGDWDVFGSIEFDGGSGTIFTQVVSGISGTTATLPASPNKSVLVVTTAATGIVGMPVPQVRVLTAASVTEFLVGFAGFTVSTASMTCTISARRR